MTETTLIETTEPQADHPVWPAIVRGLRQRCPACGEGALMGRYLKVNHACAACGQELHHHRADDGPAYLTILIAGHILAPLILWVYPAFKPDPWVMALGFSVFFTALALFLLPRLKGGLVGIQWAKRMHGFDTTRRDGTLDNP